MASGVLEVTSIITNMAVYAVGFNFLLISLLGLFNNAIAVEEVVVVHAPDSVKFVTSEPIRSSYLADIFSAMLSQTIKSNTEWHSLAAVSPWNRPEAVAVIEILGFDNDVDLPLDGTKFLLENVGDLDSQYHLPAYRIEERFFGKSPVMLHMNLGEELYESKIAEPILLKTLLADPQKRLELALNDNELGELIKESIFNVSHPADVKLLTELATLKEFLKTLSFHKSEIHDKVPDFFWFKIGGLESIISAYTTDSFQFREALRLLRQMILEVKRTMRNVYDDNVVITIIKTNSMPLTLGHKGRRLLESTTEAPVPENKYNLATKWDPMFPVIFIIMLFIGISLLLSVLAVSIALWNMDPGRDSIIYRMTSQRMKRD